MHIYQLVCACKPSHLHNDYDAMGFVGGVGVVVWMLRPACEASEYSRGVAKYATAVCTCLCRLVAQKQFKYIFMDFSTPLTTPFARTFVYVRMVGACGHAPSNVKQFV